MARFIKITFSFILLLVFGVSVATAQSGVRDSRPIKVTGQIVDAADGQSLVGANICYRDDAVGRYERMDISDYDGHFELSYPRKYFMTATRIGYKPQQLYFSSDTTILIRLEKDPTVTDCPEFILIKGVVIDERNDCGLIGASVRIKDTDFGVATDINGEFEIALQKGTTLEIYSVGYSKKTIKISNKEPIIIKLKETMHKCVP